MGKFEAALAALRGGECTYAEFVAVTRPRWQALALHVMRHWDLPSWMDREDVEQELLVAAWRVVGKFDPARGKRLEKFVVWNAIDKAKKAAHKARGANLHRNADSNPSRYELPFSAFERDGEESTRASTKLVTAEQAVQADVAARAQSLERAKTVCSSIRELLAVQALFSEGDLGSAARLLYEDVEARRLCRLGCERDAQRVVKHVARSVAERLRFLSV